MTSLKRSQAPSKTINKEGVLEFKRSEGIKKTWRPFTFKLTSTYLLCFNSTNMSKPEIQILRANVLQVVPSSARNARFPFEVIFSKGSPWKLNAGSNEERVSWMEALCPGSSESITRFQPPPPPPPLESPPPNQTLSYPQEPSPPPYDSTFVRGDPPPPPTTNNHHSFSPEERNSVPPGGTQWPRADPNTYIRSPVLSPQPDFEEEEDDDDGDDFIPASLTATLPSSFTAQEYMLPSDLETQSLKNPPIPKVHRRPQRGMSDPNVVKPKPSPRPRRNQTLGQLRTPRAPPAPLDTSSMPDDSTYVTMIPSPVHKRLPPIQSKDGRQPNYLEVVQSDDDPVLDGDNYVLSEPASIPLESATPKLEEPEFIYDLATDSGGGGRAGYSQGVESGGGASDLVNTISRRFNPDQIGLLINMLQEVRVDKRHTQKGNKATLLEGETPPTSPAPPPIVVDVDQQDASALRGNLTRALSYAPTLTERILVTEEDSEESYEARPEWAKAVHPNGQAIASEQPDSLSDLQREALYLAKKDVRELQMIGQGQFGKVFKGVLSRGSESLPVAVKMTKKTISDYVQQSFIKEMAIMSEMMHPNIVRLYGLVTEDVPSPWIVLEYMEHGDLKTFLTKNQRPIQQLVKYMVDVAMGMHYISERGLVHRDLAARNILVGASEICKVADFGLLRETAPDSSIYQSQHNIPCPIRWMPPESFRDRAFSPASDVWSFGVLVWEMFNPTKLPYESLDNFACATKVNEGYRMPTPRGIPSIITKIMKACWHKDPKKRPSFLLIATLLSTRTIM